jgi:diguanylate cyclase (GGDEF)-like protein
MPEPIDLESELSQKIISLLERRSLPLGDWEEQVARLEKEYGKEIYRHLLFVLTNLDFSARKAKTHWKHLLNNWEKLPRRAATTIDLRVVALHYFLQVQKQLKNPTVVEIKFLQETRGSAILDELTQAYNYRYFQDRILQEIKAVHRYGRGLSLLMIDIDDFKRFNDRNGHLTGNTALKKIARVFKKTVRAADVVCRYGGEEFAIILPETLRKGALAAAEKIRLKIEKAPIPGRQNQPRKRVTVSVGVAAFPTDASSAEELIQRADAALYRAKASGKNRVEAVSDERRDFARYEAQLSGSLRALSEMALPLKTSNLSQGGLLFYTTQSLAVGSLLQLDISLPGQRKPMPCTARVVRVIERERDYEVGVKIIHLESGDLHRLNRYLSRLPKSKQIRRGKKSGMKIEPAVQKSPTKGKKKKSRSPRAAS